MEEKAKKYLKDIERLEGKKAKKHKRRDKKKMDPDDDNLIEQVLGTITTTMGNTDQGLIADPIEDVLTLPDDQELQKQKKELDKEKRRKKKKRRQ